MSAYWVVCLPMHVRARLTDTARALTDRQYVLGMLRAVIACTRSENTRGLERIIVAAERGKDVYGSGPLPSTRLVELRNLAATIVTHSAVHKDYEWFAKLCDAQLLSNGEFWVDTVNRIGLDEGHVPL